MDVIEGDTINDIKCEVFNVEFLTIARVLSAQITQGVKL